MHIARHRDVLEISRRLKEAATVASRLIGRTAVVLADDVAASLMEVVAEGSRRQTTTMTYCRCSFGAVGVGSHTAHDSLTKHLSAGLAQHVSRRGSGAVGASALCTHLRLRGLLMLVVCVHRRRRETAASRSTLVGRLLMVQLCLLLGRDHLLISRHCLIVVVLLLLQTILL